MAADRLVSGARLPLATGAATGAATAPAADVATAPAERPVLERRVRLLVTATISYNVVEAVVALVAGHDASSSALVGFGLDSVVEVASAAAVAWQFSARDPLVRQGREHAALRLIALSFFALAAYVAVQSATGLLGGGRAQESRAGVVLAALSLLVMPVLSLAQRRAGRRLGSASAVADSKQTLLCTCLSAVLLAGLLLNAVLGWWWADPLAGVVIAAIAVREGASAWRGEGCCVPAGAAVLAGPGVAADGCAPACGDACACCAERR